MYLNLGRYNVSAFFLVFKPASAKTLSIHPIKNEMFACASQRGDCMLYDIRGRPGPNSLMKPIKQFSGHTKSISSAFFSPISGEKLATVAYDDKIRIYEVDAKKEQTGPAVAFYHNNQTGRWLSTFKVRAIGAGFLGLLSKITTY